MDAGEVPKENKYSFMENMRLGCQIIGFDFRYIFVNSVSAAQIEKTREELVGHVITDVFKGIEKDEPYLFMKDCLEKRNSHKTEIKWTRKDGSEQWFELNIQPVPEGLFLIVVEITEGKSAIDALKRLKNQQQAILDNIPDMAWLKDQSSRYIAVNEALRKAAGVTGDEMLGKTDSSYFPEELVKHYHEVDQRVMETGKRDIYEELFVEKDGTSHWLETCKTPIFNDEGKVTGVAGIARDITRRKQVDEELQKINHVLRAIRNVNKLITQTKDPQELLTATCKNLTDIRGYDICWSAILDENRRLVLAAESKVGTNFKGIVDGLSRGQFPNCVKLALNGGKAVVVQEGDDVCTGCFVAGKTRPETNIIVVPVKYDSKIMGTLSVVAFQKILLQDEEIGLLQELANDIGFALNNIELEAERKRAEESLIASEEKLRLILSSIADGILITDMNYKMIDCTENTIKIAHLASKDDLMGKNLMDFVPEAGKAEAWADLQTALAISGPLYKKKQYMLHRPDGVPFPVEASLSVARDNSGKPIFMVISFSDITERKELEDRILELYEQSKKQIEELQEESRARGLFIDVLAHELRTPLTPILASTGMLKDILESQPGSIQQKLSANILNSAQTLASRLEELLDLARYSRGTFKLTPQTVEINRFMEETITRFKPTLAEKEQQLITQYAPDGVEAEIDPSRLEQVIINLLSNASKFSPAKGSIHLMPSPHRDIAVYWVSFLYRFFVAAMILSFGGYIVLDLLSWLRRRREASH